MRRTLFAIALVVAIASFMAAGGASASGITRSATSTGIVLVPNAPAPIASGIALGREKAGGRSEDDDTASGVVVHRGTNGKKHGGRHGGHGNGSTPKLATSWDALNFFDSRFANGGNQFSGEPPDQGLCIGKGYVVEVVNSVYQVFDRGGHALTNPIDINSLFGYPAAINRTTGEVGPDVFDPSCLFDQQTGKFFIVASTLDGDAANSSHIDIGVASDPTKSLTMYHINTTHDASCFDDAEQTKPGACFPDYPQIGADRNGFYVTTNVFDFVGPNFEDAHIYALSKSLLASGASSVPVTLISTNGLGPAGDGGQGYTVLPAITTDSRYDDSANGTQYFASSRAVFSEDGTASSIVVWKLTNTRSLNGAAPALHLASSVVNTGEYGVPSPATQKSGQTPLAECYGSTVEVGGMPCWEWVSGFDSPTMQSENVLDGNDSRMGGVSYADGKLWTVLGSAATDSRGAAVDGVAWTIVDPHASQPRLLNDGMLVKDGTNLIFPSVAVTNAGRGAMSFTISGDKDYPSAGYAGIDYNGTSDAQYSARGKGPQDGFSEYDPFFSDGSPRPRWGDYSATVADGSTIWTANEYINQSCNFKQYLKPSPTNAFAFGTCGDTRGPLGNWSTRISQLQIGG